MLTEASMGVGRRLRHEREARGWSVREIGTRTKIPRRLIELLEAEQYERLPGGIFGRGYVRAVADAVGLDGVAMAEEFRTEIEPSRSMQVPELDEALSISGPRLRLAAEPEPVDKTGRAVAAVVLAISVLLVMLWYGMDRNVAGSSRNDSTPPSSNVRPVAKVQQPADSHGSSRTASGAIGTTGVAASRPTSGIVQLTIEAVRPCWVALTADGERVVYRMLNEGDRASVQIRDRGVLRTGDAAALKLTINGKQARPIGSSGEVRTIEITPANYRDVLGG
jgi:cytoskeleton protein RodZ